MKALHSAADLWFGRLSLSTKVVAVGLILEAPELVYEIRAVVRRKIDDWKFHITFPESHAPDWLKVVAFLGWILIVGGVVGEWFTEGKVNKADTSIQELNDISLAEATREAGAAQASAKGAASAATVAKEQSDAAVASASSALALANGARREADSFEKDIVSAKKQAANAESHLADALQRAANAERKVADRTLTDPQVASIAEKIKLFAGQKVQIMTYWDASEPLALANRILLALNLAKWQYLTPPEHTILIGGITGVQVFVHPEADEQTKNAAGSLTAALNGQGILTVPKLDAAYAKNQIMINVGAKP